MTDYIQTISDSISLSDSPKSSRSLFRMDSCILADNYTKVMNYSRQNLDSLASADQISRLVNYQRSVGGAKTLIIKQGTEAEYIYAKSSTWPPTTPTGKSSGTYQLWYGCSYVSPDYWLYRSYLRFNTSQIPAGVKPISCKLWLKLHTKNNANNFNVALLLFKANSDWYPLDTGDWGCGATQVASIAYADLPAVDTWFSLNIDPSYLNLTGYTAFEIKGDHESGIAPTSTNSIALKSGQVSGSEPYLEIKYVIEGINLTDSLKKEEDFNRFFSEFSTIIDSYSAASSFLRTIADALGISDETISELAGIILKTIFDSVGITENFIKDYGFFKGENITTRDAIIRTLNYIKIKSDSMGISDEIKRLADYQRSLAEIYGISDIVSHTLGYLREFEENAGISDLPRKLLIFVRSLTEIQGIGDAISRIANFDRKLLEAEGISEQLARDLFLAITNDVGLTDSLFRYIEYRRKYDEVFSLTDFIKKESQFYRTFTESSAITDLVLFIKGLLFTIADDVGILDQLERTFDIIRLESDDLAISDLTQAISQFLRLYADAIGITDESVKTIGFARQLIDTVGLIDVLSRIFYASYGIYESLTIADQTQKDIGIKKTETVELNDIRQLIVNYVRNLSSNINLQDVNLIGLGKYIADNLEITDQASYNLIISLIERFLSDNVGMADTLIKDLSMVKSEVLQIAEQLFRTAQYSRTKEEVTELSDKLANFFATIVSDPVLLSEIYFYSLGIDLADSLSVEDTVSRVASLNRKICETSVIYDVVSRISSYLRQIEDQEDIHDLARIGKELLAFISDTMGISDQTAYNLLRYIMARYFQGTLGYREGRNTFKRSKKYPYYIPRDYEKED